MVIERAGLIGSCRDTVNGASEKGRSKEGRRRQATRLARTVSYPAIAAARSAAGYPNKGGATRAHCESPWICASSAFIPGTNGVPSNNLRMATASERAAVSPERYARAQRSALRLAVAEMHPANGPERASGRAASVDGNTRKPGAMAATSQA